MTLDRAIYDEVLLHLRRAREEMRRLAAVSRDWVAVGLIDIEFDRFEEHVHEFAHCQLGLDLPPRAG